MTQLKDTTKLTSIGRKCYGTNKINFLTVEQLKNVFPQLGAYIGKKIKLTNGDKSKSFKVDLLQFPYTELDGGSYRVYLKFVYGRLVLVNDVTVKDKSYESGGYGCSYYKKEIDLAIINEDGILKEVFELDTTVSHTGLNILYDEARQIEISKEVELLEEQVRNLKRQQI
jgi:hypothetical protein